MKPISILLNGTVAIYDDGGIGWDSNLVTTISVLLVAILDRRSYNNQLILAAVLSFDSSTLFAVYSTLY